MEIKEKIKTYRLLCGLSVKEVKLLGNFEQSETSYRRLESGAQRITPEIEKEMYRAINSARASKIIGE